MQLSLNIDRHFHTYLILSVSLVSLGSTLWFWPLIFGRSLTTSQLDYGIIPPLFLVIMFSNMQPRIPKYWAYIIGFAIVALILTIHGFIEQLNNSSFVQLPAGLFIVSLVPWETDYVFSGVKLTPPEKGRYKEKVLKSFTNFLAIVVVLVVNHKVAKSLWKTDSHSIVVADFLGLFLSAFILLLLYRSLKDRSKYFYLIASVLSVACLSMLIAMGSTHL